MTQLHQTMTVSSDFMLHLRVPDAHIGEEVEVIVLSNPKGLSREAKHLLIAQAANDPLFRADVDEVMGDFAGVDFDTIE